MRSLKDIKPSPFGLKNSEAGQAITEYILVLAISVALILGVVYQFNSAFQTFANNYFGEYLSCLLESGELPSLGLGADAINAKGCEASFEPFSFANGRSHREDSSSGSNANSNNENLKKNNENSKNNVNNEGSPAAENQRPTSSQRFRPNSNQLSSGQNRLRSNNRRGLKQSSDAEVIIIGGGDFGSPGSSRASRSRNKNLFVSSNKNKFRNNEEDTIIIRYVHEKENKSANADTIPAEKKAQQKGSASLAIVPLPKKRAIASQEKKKGFSFGNFLKYIIIAGIIIAIIIIVGGQLLQISKSLE